MRTGPLDHRRRLRGLDWTAPIRSVLQTFDLTPGVVTAIYVVLGFLALYFSDVYLPQAIQDPEVLRQNQMLKGGVEVALTAGLIFVLTRRSRLALQRHRERLETLQAERSVLHRVFRHNLRQELNLVGGHSKLIRSTDERGHHAPHCDVIEGAAGRMEAYVEKARRFEKLLQPATAYQTVDLASMVADDEYVAELRETDDVDLVVRVPDEANAIGHPHLKSAFHEVLENAVEHNDAARTAIDISVTRGPYGTVELSVTDNGPGVPDIERRAIESMEELPLTHSGGLGLWFAKLGCAVTGGDLAIRTPEAGGSEVVLQLPAGQRPSLRQRITSFWTANPAG